MNVLYSPTHKQWQHTGQIDPNVEVCESIRPHGDWMPADWLPLGRQDERYEVYSVISVGKIVAMDRLGNIVPAGLKREFADETGGGGNVLSYDSTDYAEGVIDLGTGAALAASSKTYTKSELTAALQERGLIDASEDCDDFISHPVGIASYTMFQPPGGDGWNPADYRYHNHNLQNRVAITCDYVIEVPLIPAQQSAADVSSATGISDTQITDFTDANSDGAWFSSTALAATTRYENDVSAGDDVVGLLLAHMDVASNETLTPFAFTGALANVCTNEVSSISDISSAGDFMMDHDVGMLLVFETDGNAAAAASGTFTYFSYASAPASVSTFASAIGQLRPGDFVRTDTNSNFVKSQALDFATSDTVISNAGGGLGSASEAAAFANAIVDRALKSCHEVVGQVLEIREHPQSSLDKVRTAYTDLRTVDKMPGSATDGLPSALTYASGSNKMVRIAILR